MGKHVIQSFEPFPENIDRYAFGHWLSGFVDGEGCFFLSINTQALRKAKVPAASFFIALREDDSTILRSIQSYFQCGFIETHQTGSKQNRYNSKPATKFIVRRIADLHDIIVPHFDAFPLRAKKRNDFMIWREGVMVLSQTIKRSLTVKTQQPRRLSGKRTWSPEDFATFSAISDRLRAQREYVSRAAV